jgi:CRISPR-associated endonuclease/helicase Cas3
MHYDNILGKSDGKTLEQHRIDTIKGLDGFKKIFQNDTNNFLTNVGINVLKFWEQLGFLALNHDFGKLNVNFQAKIKNAYSSGGKVAPEYRKKDIPHNFISSLYFINEQFNTLIPGDEINICSLIAMNHHGNNRYPDSRVYTRQKTVKLVGINEYTNLDLNYPFNYLMPSKDQLDFLNNDIDSSFLQTSLLESLIKEPKSDKDVITRRWVYSLMKQYLHLSDWIASGAELHDISIADPWNRVKNILKQQTTGKTNLRVEVQNSVDKLGNRAILVAPTGSGKTEAAIKWADKMKKSRILIALPTRSLADDIYFRFQGDQKHQGYFKDKTGILHASAEDIYQENEAEDPNSHNFDKDFHRPVMLSTIDQVLFSLFNYRKWDAVNFALINGLLIIDEIHSYDKEMLGLLIELMNQTSKFKIPILLMTATLPSWMAKGIEAYTGEKWDKVEVKDSNEKNIWNVTKIKKENITKILDSAPDKNVLIVVNNVKECINIYKTVKSNNRDVICLHSRFIQKDKNEKINRMKQVGGKFKVLVSTQVVEVGIDIDYDILITELSPIDSINQRAARVNRSRNTSKIADVYVFQSEGDDLDISKLIYGEEKLKRTWEVLSTLTSNSDKIQSAIDMVYSEKNELEILQNSVQSTHKRVMTCEKYGGSTGGREGDGVHSLPANESELPISIREQKYVTVDVVPEQFKSDVSTGELDKYTIRVPIKSYYRYIDLGHVFPKVIHLKYNDETGLEYPEELDKDAFFI